MQAVLDKLSTASGMTTVPTSAPAPQSASFEDELKRVNQEIYERNVELTIRNRTFSILQKIYEIINTGLGVEETAQKLIMAIVQELQFRNGMVALRDKKNKFLQSIAVGFLTQEEVELTKEYNYPFRNLYLPLTNTDNFLVRSLINNKTHLTNDLNDILMPFIDEKKSAELAEKLNIKTCIVYPINFAGNTIGVMMFGMDKHIGFLSRAEREILKELIEVVAIAIERAQIYEDLKDANERLKEVDKLKDEFVSVASHELRTPMTAIKSYLWMALAGKGGPINEKQKYYLDRAYNSTDRLIKLVNDMLNISRIESGRMTFAIKEVDLPKLVDDVIAEVKPRADELGLTVEISQSRPLSAGSVKISDNNVVSAQISTDSNRFQQIATIPHVIADPDKIQEVLMNLVGNSLKFTPRGGKISISFEVKGDEIITHVTDTGVGLEPDDKEKLFQKFGLIQGSYVTNQNAFLGTGLGLYICKEIIELHKGKIWADSEGRNKGATFSFSLKLFNETTLASFSQLQQGKGEVGIIHNSL